MKDFTSGESIKFEKSFALYPATEWTLVYHVRGKGKGFDLTATANGLNFVVEISAEVSDKSSAGQYFYQGFVSKGSEKILVDSGSVNILPNLSQIQTDAEYDGRSDAEKVLAAIDAVLANRATTDQQSYVIGNRQLTRIPVPDLLLLRDKYQTIVNNQKRRKAMASGLPFLKNIDVRFNNPK